VVVGVKNQAEPPNPQCPDSSRSWFRSRAVAAAAAAAEQKKSKSESHEEGAGSSTPLSAGLFYNGDSLL
jgi:hypothetical protein